jgi:beta-N-acetylhexosaminidase
MKRLLYKLCTLLSALVLALSPACALAAETDAGSQSVSDIVASMTLDEKLSQMIIVAARTWSDGSKSTNVTDLDAQPELAAALARHQYGGIILFGANIVDNAQTAKLITQLQENNKRVGASTYVPYFTPVDEEGGIVTRLSAGTRMTGSMAIGATGEHAPENALTTGTIIGEELSALGFNVDFAPSIDVNSNPDNPAIGTRAFSDDPAVVAQLGPLFAKGLAASDVVATYKHFPGHGDTATDTHIGTAAVNKTIEQLRATELAPFKAAVEAGAEMIMTAHVTLPLYDDPVTFADGTQGFVPATMSRKAITELLRGELGFQGVVVTDALEMDAVDNANIVPGAPGSVESRANIAEMVINAGVDILLIPTDITNAAAVSFYDEYLAALAAKVEAGSISQQRIDESVTRILSLKEAHGFLHEAKPAGDLSVVGSAKHHEDELDIAREAITLVKNDAVLPVDGSGVHVVLAGRTAGDCVAFDHAVSTLQQAGVIDEDAYVVNLASGKSRGQESSPTRITIDYTYDATGPAVHYTDALKAAVADASVVVGMAKTYALSALKAGAPQYEAIHQVLADTHAAGGKYVFISDNLPYDVARYQDADALLLAYMGTGTELDPTERGSANVGAINANVIAAIQAVFGNVELQGKLPVVVPQIVEAADGTLSYSSEPLYQRGFGMGLREGWVQASDGAWRYYRDNEAVKGWFADPETGLWYHFGETGAMDADWFQDSDGRWYYLNGAHDGSYGAMKTGWVKPGAHWYYLSEATGGPKGAMMTGWQQVGGFWYYLYPQAGAPQGACAIDTVTPDGYRVDASGRWVA